MMTGEEKAAVLLLTLPSEAAESVLAQLEPEQTTRLRGRMRGLEGSPRKADLLDQVLREFDDMIRVALPEKAVAVPEPGPASQEAPGESESEVAPALPSAPEVSAPASLEPTRQPEAPATAEAEGGDPFAALKLLAPDRLAAALQGELPRTVALMLGLFEPAKGGEILKRLPPDARRQVTLLLGKNVSAGPEVLQRVARAILQKALALGENTSDSSSASRYKKMADMLRALEKPDRLDVLGALMESDPDVAAGVKEYLYQFEDLLSIEDRSMQKVLSEIDSKNLAVALKNAPDNIKDKVMANLSKRARDTLTEEMEFLASVPNQQIQQAQKVVVEVIQRLDQAGELVML